MKSSNLDYESIHKILNASGEGERRQFLMNLSIPDDLMTVALVAHHLGDPSPAVCEAAVEALSRCENLMAAEATAVHLHSTEAAERGYALETLIRLRTHALPILIHLLMDSDPNICQFAIDAIGRINEPECLPVLLRELASEEILVAAAAAIALGQLDNPEALPALAAALLRGPDWVRISALASLGKIGGEEALAYICSLPPGSPAYVQAAAVKAVSSVVKNGSPAAYSFLASWLDPQKPTLQEEIVKTLGVWIANEKLSMTGAALAHQIQPFQPAIRAGLNSQDAQVRASAATCLRCAFDDFEKTMLWQLLKDKDVFVRQAALNTLAFHTAMSCDELSNIALDEEEDGCIRISALHFLSNVIQDKATLNDLVKAGMIRLGSNAFEPSIRAAAMRVLLLCGAEEGIAAAIALLTEDSFDNDEAALAELINCPADFLVPIALKGLNETDPSLRLHIYKTIFQPERTAEFIQLPDGRALVTACLSDHNWRMRVHSVTFLGKCVDQAWARELLRSACEDSDERVRAFAIDAFATSLESNQELEILRAYLSDPIEKLQAAATSALSRLEHLEKRPE